MRTRFLAALDELKRKLLEMGGLAEQALDLATQAYRTRDVKLCETVLTGENAIDRAQREIDELALDLLAMQQPMAVDLRFITAVTKINADLERIGDQAVNIAERVLNLISLPETDLPVDVPRLSGAACGMVRRALEAFIMGDSEMAQAVLQMDDIVDRMNRDVFRAMVRRMRQDPEIVPQCLDALSIARNFERVGDHATNIAEDVIFWVRGADVRHHGSGEPPAG